MLVFFLALGATIFFMYSQREKAVRTSKPLYQEGDLAKTVIRALNALKTGNVAAYYAEFDLEVVAAKLFGAAYIEADAASKKAILDEFTSALSARSAGPRREKLSVAVIREDASDFPRGEIYLARAFGGDKSEKMLYKLFHRNGRWYIVNEIQVETGISVLGEMAASAEALSGRVPALADKIRGFNLESEAIRHLGTGRADEARKTLLESLDSNPASGSAFVLLAVADMKLGMTAEALQALDNAERTGEPLPIVFFYRARLLADEKKYEEAKQQVYRYIKAVGPDEDAMLLAGYLREKRGDSDGAMLMYSAAGTRYPASAQAVIMRAKLLEKTGRFDEAMQAFRKAPSANPNCEDAYVELADRLFSAKAYSELLAVAAKYEKAFPKSVNPHVYRGMVDFYSGNFAPAAACFEKALNLAPEKETLYNWSSAAYRKAGMLSEAADAARRGIDKFPSSAEIWVELACAEAQRKNYQAAADAIKKALELDPAIRATTLTEPDLKEFMQTAEAKKILGE